MPFLIFNQYIFIIPMTPQKHVVRRGGYVRMIKINSPLSINSWPSNRVFNYGISSFLLLLTCESALCDQISLFNTLNSSHGGCDLQTKRDQVLARPLFSLVIVWTRSTDPHCLRPTVLVCLGENIIDNIHLYIWQLRQRTLKASTACPSATSWERQLVMCVKRAQSWEGVGGWPGI